MSDAEFIKAVAKFGGWIEADKAKFSTIIAMASFVAFMESKS